MSSATGLSFENSEMERRIREFGWSATPLGSREHWPPSLRTVVNILLSSRYSMWMAWGTDLTMLYNDSYRPTLGIKHPMSLGKSSREVWAEIWSDIGPRIESVLTTGKATYDEGLLLFLERSGFPEETYHTFSYSPLAHDDGRICGMLCVVTEETDRVIGERRVQTLRAVASALANTHSEEEVLQAADRELSLNKKDLPFSLTYLFDDSGRAHLASSSGILRDHPLAPKSILPGEAAPWPVHEILAEPVSRLLETFGAGNTITGGEWSKRIEQAALVPIRSQGQDRPAGVFIVGVNPFRRYDSAYSGFVTLLSGQLASALGNARAYEALAEIDRAKTKFFSNASHELRTPLTLMLSPVEELLGAEPAGERRDLLSLVHRNGLRLQKLVNTLLDFSRIEAGRMQSAFEPTDLAGFTAELAANFESSMKTAGLEFRIDCSPLASLVYIDREMWEKVVLNLVSNALKFTLQGVVTVRIESGSEGARLIVEDTGSGIPSAEIPHIFERFHRVSGARGRSIEGTGIGLALVQELVKMHGGTIGVRSELARGSVFTVTIPFGSDHLPPDKVRATEGRTAAGIQPASASFVGESLRWLADDPAATTAGTPSAAAERVLLADDNADIREYVARLLGKRYRVAAVSNGEDALRSALAEPPDLILSDVMMPGLDGFELLDKLRSHAETKTIPVILLSARAGEESRVEGFGAGADDYLIKPFTARELLARVDAHLSMRRRRREAERALEESRLTLQSFYDSSSFLMGVAEIDGDDMIALYGNAATSKFFGVDVQPGQRFSTADFGLRSALGGLWKGHFRTSEREARPVRFEYQHPAPAGLFWLSSTVNFLGHGPQGHPRFSFVAEDITERRRSDDRLKQSNEELRQANSDLEQFAYSASHDLQEPLRQVAIYSQLLEKKYAAKLDGKALQYLEYCIEGAQRMEMLITDLLAYSQAARTSAKLPERIGIADVMADATKNLATSIKETGAEIVLKDLPSVYGDTVPLVHLFQNLLSNALKYRTADRPFVTVSALKEGSFWRFSVQDNGIGIAKEYQTQIFGIFKRLHDRAEYPGTGIGLAICQKIVERYGGRIWVESELGRGSTFFFTLPESGHGR